MALCAVADASGVLHLQPTDPTQCPGAVLLSATEYTGFLTVSGVPSSAELGAAFQAGFVIPMACYLVAYCAGRIVGVFNSDS